ncbi:Importin subunit alpha [Capsicum chinense]|nr:Importin subunit alpha [Capsicum chinense]
MTLFIKFFDQHSKVSSFTTYNLALYYMMNSPLEDSPLLESFVKGDDSYRNSMFKLIPYISEAVWGLGNIASDSPKYRDLVLGHGALVSLLTQFNEHVKLSMLRNATWTLSNFCRGKPQPQFEQTKASLPTLARLIHSNDEIVLTDTCRALSYLSNGTNDKIQDVSEDGVCPRLVSYYLHLLFVSSHSSLSVLIPTLHTVGNIVIGDNIQTQVMIDHHALACLLNLLTQNYKKCIKKLSCLDSSKMSTVREREPFQCDSVMIEAGIIAPLVHLLQNAEFEIKKEAAWAISNSTSGGNMPSYQVWFL